MGIHPGIDREGLVNTGTRKYKPISRETDGSTPSCLISVGKSFASGISKSDETCQLPLAWF